MIAYHDKINDLKFVLSEDKIIIEREEIKQRYLNKNQITVEELIETYHINEIAYSQIEVIHFNRISSIRNKVIYHCNLNIKGRKNYKIIYHPSSLLASDSRKKEFILFIRLLHQKLQEQNKVIVYSKGEWGSFLSAIIFPIIFCLFYLSYQKKMVI